MQNLKYSAFVFAALAIAAVAYGQAVKPGKEHAKIVPITSAPNVPKPASGIISAFPVDPDSPEYKKREAAFVPSGKYIGQAQALSQAGDLTGAEQAYLNALDAAPVIQGQKQDLPFVSLLLGQTYLKDGQYQKAIHWLGGARQHTGTVGGGLDMDLALAYIRMGDYANASRRYSDQAALHYYGGSKNVLLQDLPGTDTPQALEASILLARGQDMYMEHRHDEALVDFQAAARLAPDNFLIAYVCADILNEKGRLTEAAPFYQFAAAKGHGFIAEDSGHRLQWIKSSLAAAARAKQ